MSQKKLDGIARGRSRAVLLGCHEYTHQSSIPAVSENVRKLHELLLDPELCLSGTDITPMGTWASADEILDTVEEAAVKAEDTLIVYFAGHGLIHPRTGELYLALHNSRLRTWGVSAALHFNDLRNAMLDVSVAAKRKVLILDCCYSGRAVGGMSASVPENVAALTAIEGTCVTTSSSATSPSFAPEKERYTAFTGALIDVLESGVPGAGPMLSMEKIFQEVGRRLSPAGRPRPQQHNSNLAGHIRIARNRAYKADSTEPAPAADLPPRTIPPPRQGRLGHMRVLWRRNRGNLRYLTLTAFCISLAAFLPMLWPDSDTNGKSDKRGHSDTPTQAPDERIPPDDKEPTLLRSVSAGGKDCVNHLGNPPTGRAPVKRCDLSRQDWSMWIFPNKHVRFVSRRFGGICLGVNTNDPQRPVGTWDCNNPDSAWIRKFQPDGTFFLENEQANLNGWTKKCAVRDRDRLRLDECTNDEVHKWRLTRQS